MDTSTSIRHHFPVLHRLILFLLSFAVLSAAQNCSAANPCSTGCCSKYGYCGTGDSFCAPDVCVDTCNYSAPTQCNATHLCTTGCCSTFGVCGLGPDYCSKENCVSTCDAKSECDPGHWGPAYATSETCPLNVCCSKYGFCGTTTEFCGKYNPIHPSDMRLLMSQPGNEKVQRPSCDSTTGSLARVVGYYEGWSTRRPCNAFYPEQIPLGVYTHLIYAFASIDPTTFAVVPATQYDISLYARLTGLKNQDPDIRVSISIGGWSFNDPGPTATTFSDLVASEDNQRAFFTSLVSFMATYNFDGVDIDWEYPAAEDRSGRAEDFANFPKFMANLRSALQSTGGRDIISMTLPTSYWYLQHFDIQALEPSVDFFNYMAYDLHGTWDQGDIWTGPYLNAHTNLTEITTDLDLLWRNNISPDKVVLGLAFYGRGFTVSDTSCMTPGCTFSSGSVAGNCSLTTGILMASEIETLIEQNLNPVYDDNAAVAMLSWGNQWIGYDDVHTFREKTKFARSQCLGGVMVWAVSQDMPEAYDSLALRSAQRPFVSYQLTTNNEEPLNPPIVTTATQHNQCKWTGCGEVCPSGYMAVSRSDSDAKSGELMLDGTGCEGDGVHTFCCPTDETVPTCGWYGFKNGNCGCSDCYSQCPSGMLEVGSNSQYCHNSNYESACCTSKENSMAVYNTLEWSEWPNCNAGTCPWQASADTVTLTSSSTGSGGAMCNAISTSWSGYSYSFQERKLCHNPNAFDITLESCSWVGGTTTAGASCTPTCPQSQIRLAMNTLNDTCLTGATAFCCDGSYATYTETPSPALVEFEDDLSQFLAYGYCPVTLTFGNQRILDKRLSSDTDVLPYLAWTLAPMLSSTDPFTALQQAMANYFDQVMQKLYPRLSVNDLQIYYSANLAIQVLGEYSYAVDVLCRPDTYNDLLGNQPIPFCAGVDECTDSPDLCLDPEVSSLSRRSTGSLPEKRAPKSITVWCASTSNDQTIRPIPEASYPSSGDWAPWSTQFMNSKQLADEDDCGNPTISTGVKDPSTKYHTEHIIEMQLIPRFFYTLTSGTLVSGAAGTFTPLDCSWFLSISQGGLNALYSPLATLSTNPSYAGGSTSPVPAVRIMAALGSNTNTLNFYILQSVINGVKSNIFGNVAPVADDRMTKAIDDVQQPGLALKYIRDVIAVWYYMNDPAIQSSMVRIFWNVNSELVAIDTAWSQLYNQQLGMAQAWQQFYPDLLDYQATRSLNWVNQRIDQLRSVWIQQPTTNANRAGVLDNIWRLSINAASIIYANKNGLP